MIKKASEAGAEAYKKEQSQSTRRKVDRMLYKTKVLLEKYTWLKAYAKNSVYTLEQAEKVNDGMADIEVLTKFGIFDNDKTLHNLKRGVITVNMLMTHVDNMLEVYRENCESSASKTKQRQYHRHLQQFYRKFSERNQDAVFMALVCLYMVCPGYQAGIYRHYAYRDQLLLPD